MLDIFAPSSDMLSSTMSDTTKKKRRQRAVLSCNDCRRRKLKCDRELPCDRCINGGVVDSCAYGFDAHTARSVTPQVKRKREESIQQLGFVAKELSQPLLGIPAHSQPTQSDITAKDRVKQLEREVALLKQQLAIQRNDYEDCSRDTPESNTNQPTIVMGLLKGRHYATFFFGPSSPLSMMAQFPDLRCFMKDLYQNSTARRLAHDMRAFEGRAQSMSPSYRVLSIPTLRSLLPDRATVDILIQQYLDTFETTYRILHVPSFRTAYEDYWKAEESTNTGMDALVLAILACTICTSTHDHPRYNHNGSTFHSKALLWIKACEAWLKRHSNKHRTLTSLQVRCLRLLAFSTTSYKVKEFYQEVQAHIAFMRSSGLHRDPSIFGDRCSVFEGEMRRRLWATSIELELHASLQKGTPSVHSGLDHDCAPPGNINDADICTELKELPQALPITTFTDTSFLHASSQTMALRTKLCTLINSLKSTLTFQETLQYADTLQKCLQTIPDWSERRSKQARALLDLQLRQYQIILLTSRALRMQPKLEPEHCYSMIAVLESSARIADLHTQILDISNLALCCTRFDYYRAGLLICHIAYHSSKAGDAIMAQLAKASFDQCMPSILRLAEERSMRHGRGGGQQHWSLSAAAALVSQQFNPSKSENLRTQAIDRVARIFYKMLSLQDEPDEQSLAREVSFASAATALMLTDEQVLLEDTVAATAPTNASAGSVTEPFSMDAFTNSSMRLDGFDLGGTSEWMLDDLWFFNDIPPLEFNS